ncbi:MAG TPA: hypothetical protein VFU25_03455 [Ornithinibacter sp.]|nr:hypothetical protein [Ornithinibacter sp.]
MRDTSRRALGGPGVVLVVVYGVLALAATGRSILQITTAFDEAPLAYSLSALAAAVYLLATWCLARGGRWVRVGVAACAFELVGVIVVGAASLLVPEAFPDRTVWSQFGRGYGLVPLVLPVLGLLWFRHVDREASAEEARVEAASGPPS